MEKEEIPLDAIYYDIDYMDGYRVFTTNKKTFGDLAVFLEETKKKDIHNVYIVDPGIKIDENYSVYKELKESGGYLKKKNGTELVIKVWPGKTIIPDFADESTSKWWSNLHKKWLTSYPFDGIWNDMNEPSNFDGGNSVVSTGYTKKGSVEDEYNIYGYNMAKASKRGWELYKKESRVLNITRSGYPGVQQHAVIWHGDNYAWWEHLRLAYNWLLGYSLAGAFYTGADVPGFTGNAPDDLAIRFFQLGAFMPLFRGHSIFFAKDKEPYVYRSETRTLIKDAINLRYSLLREWYSGFSKAIEQKQSPYEPIFTEKGAFVPDQFLLFSKLLVAPIMQRDEQKKVVYLPKGIWYPLGDTKRIIKGDTWLSIDATLETIPVYVKGGTILTRNTPGITTKDTLKNKEYFEVYKDEKGNAKGYWYDDDGISVTSRKSEYVLELEGENVAKVPITEQ